MTKDMETPAALLIAACNYGEANRTYFSLKRNLDVSKAAFIAGAEWKQAQFDADRETHLLVRDQNTIISQSATISQMLDDERAYKLQIDRRTEERNNFADRIRVLESDNARLEKERDAWSASSARLTDEIHTLRMQFEILRGQTVPALQSAVDMMGGEENTVIMTKQNYEALVRVAERKQDVVHIAMPPSRGGYDDNNHLADAMAYAHHSTFIPREQVEDRPAKPADGFVPLPEETVKVRGSIKLVSEFVSSVLPIDARLSEFFRIVRAFSLTGQLSGEGVKLYG